MKEQKQLIDDLLKDFKGQAQIYLKDLNTGMIIKHGIEREVHAASTIKLLILYEALLIVDDKSLDLKDHVAVSED